MVLVQNWSFLHVFILGNRGQENVFYDIPERKKVFLCCKNKKFKNVFYDILARKKKKKKFKKSKN